MKTLETQLLISEQAAERLQHLYPEPGAEGEPGMFVCLEMTEGETMDACIDRHGIERSEILFVRLAECTDGEEAEIIPLSDWQKS